MPPWQPEQKRLRFVRRSFLWLTFQSSNNSERHRCVYRLKPPPRKPPPPPKPPKRLPPQPPPPPRLPHPRALADRSPQPLLAKLEPERSPYPLKAVPRLPVSCEPQPRAASEFAQPDLSQELAALSRFTLTVLPLTFVLRL